MNPADKTSSPAPETVRSSWIDLARVVSSFLVVLLHLEGYVFVNETILNEHPTAWWSNNVLRTLTAVAVPLFFMISGYLLLRKDEPIKVFYLKRASKIVIPFLFWSLFYHAMRLASGLETWNGIPDLLRTFCTLGFSYHLWFLYVIASIYLIVPLLRKYIAAADENNLRLFLGIWLFFESFVYMIQYLQPFTTRFTMEFVTEFAGFFVLGHYLGKKEVTERTAWFSLAGFVLLALATILGNRFFVLPWAPTDTVKILLLHPNSLNVVFMSSCLFLCFKYWGNEIHSPWLSKLVSFLAPLSFGIYLVHLLFVILLSRHLVDLCLRCEILSGATMFLIASLCFSASALIIYVIRLLPFGKAIAP